MKEKKEQSIIIILSCILVLLLVTYLIPQKEGSKVQEITPVPDEQKKTLIEDETSFNYSIMKDINAADLVRAMKVGWNLGNTFDSYSIEGYPEEIKAKYHYQLISTYSSSPYTNWNSSDKVTFDSNGYAELTWDLSKIISSDSTQYGSIGLQIFNFRIGPTGESRLIIEIKDAILTFSDGTSINLEEFLGTHELMMNLGVAKFYPEIFALSNFSTATLKTAVLSLKVQITNYLSPEFIKSKSSYYETLWYNPITTNEMISFIKQSGFGAIRIPITYRNHIDSSTNTIDSDWLDRIEEVIQYALRNDLYCIINLHHDVGSNGWLRADLKNYELNSKKFASLWNQIATRFQKYNEHLIFEGFNEILNETNEWDNPTKEDLSVVNKLNQLFVDTVRLTGGNNTSRCLIVSTYGATWNKKVLSAFELPTDSIANRLIVSVHAYEPKQFCLQESLLSNKKGSSIFRENEDNLLIEQLFISLEQTFVSNHIPVIIGEFASFHKNNCADRAKHAKSYISYGKQYHITCFWWDSGGQCNIINSIENSCLLDRYNLTWNFPEIVNALCTQ